MSYFLDIMFETTSLPLPITNHARATALEFAQVQPTSLKARQVKLNTLAVCVVRDYLELMAIPVDLEASYSWNPGTRLMADTADLVLPGVGRLECRPLRQDLADITDRSICELPPEVQVDPEDSLSDRLGYVVVQIDQDFQSANILGFHSGTSDTGLPLEHLRLNQLQPIEALLDCVAERLEHSATHPQAANAPLEQVETGTPQSTNSQPAIAATTPRRNHLSHWLDNVFDSGWETLESLLLTPAYAFRGPELRERLMRGETKRIKVLQLSGADAESFALGLMISLEPIPDTQRLGILVQLIPMGDRPVLPAQVELSILDEAGKVFQTARSREQDGLIQLQLRGQPEEMFSVCVSLDNNCVTEAFVI